MSYFWRRGGNRKEEGEKRKTHLIEPKFEQQSLSSVGIMSTNVGRSQVTCTAVSNDERRGVLIASQFFIVSIERTLAHFSKD